MRPVRLLALVFVPLGASCLAPAKTHAAWPHDPHNGNLALCHLTSEEFSPKVVSDGAGGAIVVWEDYRTGTSDIYAQRVDASGTPLWTPDGVPVCAAVDDQVELAIVSDGAGGVIVAWRDLRNGIDDIFAQRVNGAGVPQWAPDGVAICVADGSQDYARIVSDGAGGAILAWRDRRSDNGDIYARRVYASGAPQWTADGVALCAIVGIQEGPEVASDGAGGAIVTWHDDRFGNNDIHAQRVNAAGVPQWAANGVPLCTAANHQEYPRIVSDGAGGAVVIWEDFRNAFAGSDLYGQRVSAAGTPLWAPNGIAVSAEPGDQEGHAIASDGAGGAIVTWHDFRGLDSDVYIQRVGAAGALQWKADGFPLCTAPGHQGYPSITSDGAGGVIVAWQDRRSGNYDIYAQRINGAGTVQWTGFGEPLCSSIEDQHTQAIASDGAGGGIVAWIDARGGSYDIYAQRVERFGRLGNPEPLIAGVGDVPNDQGGKVKVSWYASYLDRELDPNLVAYDVYRSVTAGAATRAVQAGARRLTGFGDVPQPGEPAFVLAPSSAQGYAWQYLATVNAVHFLEAYAHLATTTTDSVPGSNPPTYFMVVGRNASGSKYWLSAPDSGYSVDNLPPAVPAPFTGTYTSGTVELAWGANQEADFAHYRLYRAWGPNFVPAPGNLVVQTPTPGYAYAPGEYFFYKLSAVDIHGNESGFASLAPPGTLDASGGGVPARLALGPAQPNPVAEGTEFRFALPRAGPVRVELFDAHGRRIRELVSGWLPAGEHHARWDGLDAAGRRVPSGHYVCRLESDGRTLTRRLAAIH